jgi:hypothetical protein
MIPCDAAFQGNAFHEQFAMCANLEPGYSLCIDTNQKSSAFGLRVEKDSLFVNIIDSTRLSKRSVTDEAVARVFFELMNLNICQIESTDLLSLCSYYIYWKSRRFDATLKERILERLFLHMQILSGNFVKSCQGSEELEKKLSRNIWRLFESACSGPASLLLDTYLKSSTIDQQRTFVTHAFSSCSSEEACSLIQSLRPSLKFFYFNRFITAELLSALHTVSSELIELQVLLGTGDGPQIIDQVARFKKLQGLALVQHDYIMAMDQPELDLSKIKALENLRWLHLVNCYVAGREECQFLNSLPHLTHLKLQLAWGRDGEVSFREYLKHAPLSIESLVLVSFKKKILECMPQVLRLPNLTALEIVTTIFNEEEMQETHTLLSGYLKALPKFKELIITKTSSVFSLRQPVV